MVQKYSEKATPPRQRKEKGEKHVWLSGRLHIDELLNEGPRLQWKHKDEHETKEKDGMTSADQTPGGYKFAPLVAINSQQWRANQHESACFGLSSRWSFPSSSGIRLHAVV